MRFRERVVSAKSVSYGPRTREYELTEVDYEALRHEYLLSYSGDTFNVG